MAKTLGAAATALLAASLLACDGTPTQPDLPPRSSLALAVTAHQSQPRGDVTLDLTVTNRGTAPVTITLSDGCEVNYVVSRAASPVWRWENHSVCTMAVVERRLGPGEILSYGTNWDLRADDGSAAAPAIYTLHGALRTLPRIESPAVTFEVE